MRYLYALIGLLVMLAATAAAVTSTVIVDEDNYVDADNANQSFSDSDTLLAASADEKPIKEVYLSIRNNFNTTNVFSSEDIKSATLDLTVTQAENPGEMKIYFVHGAAIGITWLNKPEYDSSVSVAFNAEGKGSQTLDVTPLIKKAAETCADGCPFSFVIVAGDNASVGFASSEGSEKDKPSLKYQTTG
ncbi:Uncharacterised protein [uncultured archaeon]|nr:Uncharacterised protein [uncultured archaeon]